MKENRFGAGALLCQVLWLAAAVLTQLPAQAASVQRLADWGQFGFEANRGQAAEAVRFLSRGPDYLLLLTAEAAVLGLSPAADRTECGAEPPKRRAREFSAARLTVRLLAANPTPRIEGLEELPYKVNHLRAAQSLTGIPVYGRVRYRQVYPGIDLVYYSHERQLEYDFVLAPGADPENIRFSLSGAGSFTELEIDPAGDLLWRAGCAQVRLRRPKVYQEIDGKRRELEASFVLQELSQAGGDQSEAGPAMELGFRIAAYDRQRPLVIDPVLAYSSFLGGSRADYGNGIAVDRAGNVYLTGETLSSDFPVSEALFATAGGDSDAFVIKLDASGKALAYATYLGGSFNDQGNGIAVDKAGYAFVAGQTWSPDFASREGSYPRLEANADAFVVKLTPDGRKLVYTTYLGGSDYDSASSIAIDGAGNAYVTGETASPDFPARNGLSSRLSGGSDAFVVKLAASGKALTYGTYLGGSGYDVGRGIAIDGAGNAYVTGETASPDFPARNGLSSRLSGGSDAFVVKLATSGKALSYGSYLGGSGFEEGDGIAVDRKGNVYLTGWTWSSDFPTVEALYPNRAGAKDAFVVKLDSRGRALFSTYLGGSRDDVGYDIAVDENGSAYVTGSSKSADFPVRNALYPKFGGDSDAFLVKLDSAAGGMTLGYATYLGGSGADEGKGVAVDREAYVYLTGQTWSADFPAANALYPTLKGGADVFVIKLR